MSEMFSLFVKLSMGTPVRQRRHMPYAPPTIAVTPQGEAMADLLCQCFGDSLKWKPNEEASFNKLW